MQTVKKIILVVVIAAVVVLSVAALVPWSELWRASSTDRAMTGQSAAIQDAQWQSGQRWVRVAAPRGSSAATLRLQVIRPGIILPSEAETYPPAPADLRIVITRQGNEPAQIDVRQGDREWKVTENQLDKLPPDVRQQVQRPLGWVLEGPAARDALSTLLPPTPVAPALGPTGSTSGDRLEERLDEFNARLDGLFKSIEAMRESR
jgi:hypothetical protein